MLVVESIARELHRRGVRHIFGIPGKESLRLGVESERLGLEFCAARHETQAVMMADGYWRASGRIGVALLAQGAGFANGLPGMACAARAGSGVVVISGDLLRSDAGADPRHKALRALKGIDPELAAEAVNVEVVRPTSTATFLDDLHRCLDLAASGCAVYLCVPSDLLSAQIVDAPPAAPAPPQVMAPARQPDPETVDELTEFLCMDYAARRPVILAGRGAVSSDAIPALRELGDRIGALLVTTLAARSAFRGDPYDAGVCGTFSNPVMTQFVSRADTVLAFGASLNPFTSYGNSIFPKGAQIIQVDANEQALGRYLDADVVVHADARELAEQLLAAVDGRAYKATGLRTGDVAEQLAAYNPRGEFSDASDDGRIDPRTLMSRLDEVLPRDRILAVDAGMHLHYAITFLEVQGPRDFVFPIESLAVGLGMGAAIGAAAARRDRTTVLEVGDAGFMMALGDLDTAVRLGLPLVVIVSNDHAWGAELQHLQMLQLPEDHVRMDTPSLAAIATAMGAEGHTISSPDDLVALEGVLGRQPDKPVVLDCLVHPDIQPPTFNFDYAGMFAK